MITDEQTGTTTVHAGKAGTRSVLARPRTFGSAQRAQNAVTWLTAAWVAEGTTWKDLGWHDLGGAALTPARCGVIVAEGR